MRPIDADKLIECINIVQEWAIAIGGDLEAIQPVNEGFISLINSMPTVKAEPEHGYWVCDPNGMDWNLPAWVCSECGGKNDMIPTSIAGPNGVKMVKDPTKWSGSEFCPHCGAKMDERKEE